MDSFFLESPPPVAWRAGWAPFSVSLFFLSSLSYRQCQCPAGPVVAHREDPARHGRQGGLQPARRGDAVGRQREFHLRLDDHAAAGVRRDNAVHAHVQGRDGHAGGEVGDVLCDPKVGGARERAREFDPEDDSRVGAGGPGGRAWRDLRLRGGATAAAATTTAATTAAGRRQGGGRGRDAGKGDDTEGLEEEKKKKKEWG